MKYRSILWIAILLLAASVSGNCVEEFRGFWVDAWHSGFENSTATQTMVNYVDSTNSNAVIVEVRKRGDAYYASTLEPTGTSITPAAGYDSLADIVTKAHAAGLKVYVWVVTYRVWTSTTAPPTTSPNHVFNTHPEWFNLTNTGAKFDGSSNSYLDPGHPGVEDFLVSVYKEIITNYNIDGFVLDYIRYPGTTWGYNATSVSRYNTEYGLSGSPTYTSTQWLNWRRDQVTNLVKRTYLEAKAIKPTLRVGAAVWKTASTGNSGYLQNWDLWMSSHFLDFCCPMNYTTTNSDFNNNNSDSYNRMYGRDIYIAQGSYLNTISNSMVQIASVQTMGFPGVTPYCYAVTNSGTVDRTSFKNSLLAGPFATTATVPVLPWIDTPTLGMLKGTVKDISGNAVYPATVTISNKSTKNTGTGFYGFVDLTPGTYTVTASASGYNNATGQITITAGQVKTLNLTLTTGGGSGEIIIDNPSASFTGTWTTGTSATDKYGADYRYATTASSETATAIWRPSIPTAGSYDVYVWYPQGSNRSIKAPYTIYYSGGSQTYQVNQTANGGTWVYLGTKSFAAGTSGYVKLGNGTAESSKVVMADAVKFVPAAATEYIIDNPSASFTGTWTTGTSATDKYGADYRYATTASSETATAIWRPNIDSAGTFDVYCWYPQGSNRSAAAPYTVYWSGGSQTVSVNQTTSGGQWVLLVSNKSFAAGTSGYVKLGNGTAESSKVVMADAIRFVRK